MKCTLEALCDAIIERYGHFDRQLRHYREWNGRYVTRHMPTDLVKNMALLDRRLESVSAACYARQTGGLIRLGFLNQRDRRYL